MPKKSVFAQLDARAVPLHKLMPSPRCWNPGLLRYRDKLWMTYRFHRAETPDARCGTAICEINPKTAEPLGPSQMLRFADHGTAHHEDARLFMFRGEPHVSYTDMQGYVAGVDYNCVMKYARLKLSGKKWSVAQEWQPNYGNNTGFSKEKNWVFFEHENELFCIYATDPEHVVLKMDCARVVQEFKTPGPLWQWGHVRGGTPPVDLGDGRMLVVFHSSIPTEEPPHYVRYYAAALTFEKKPPFRVLQISETPIMAGSEEDGHKVDPRFVAGWKPYVNFPGGLVPDGDGWLVAFGVNDWQSAVGRLTMADMKLGAPDGSSFKPRFFRVENGSVPVKYIDGDQLPVFIRWEVVGNQRGCAAGAGFLQIAKPRESVEVAEHPGVAEIEAAEYEKATRSIR